jgi:hypothetical protein
MRKKIERSDIGRTKKGSREEGTQASHIYSFEVMNHHYSSMPGRPYGEEQLQNIRREINDSENVFFYNKPFNMFSSESKLRKETLVLLTPTIDTTINR